MIPRHPIEIDRVARHGVEACARLTASPGFVPAASPVILEEPISMVAPLPIVILLLYTLAVVPPIMSVKMFCLPLTRGPLRQYPPPMLGA